MSAIRLEEINKSFGPVRALDALTLNVRSGELLALLGPSGCGKTTLLRVIAGLEQPDGGRVWIAEQDVTDKPARLRSIGMVFQSYALFPNLTVRQNISFPLEVRHIGRDEASDRVGELLELVRLVPEADRYPHQISGGQAQRCALARALAPRPDVLLLDEPLSALDVVVRLRLRDEIRRVQESVATTTVYVTHDQSEALAIADRVALMNRGRVVQIGPPAEIYEEPSSSFAATFVGNRNAVELPVRNGRLALGSAFDVSAPAGGNGRAVVFIAPEDVTVGRPTEVGEPATVVGRTFHGATTRLHLVIEVDGQKLGLYADMPTRGAAAFGDNTTVALRIDAAHVRAFVD